MRACILFLKSGNPWHNRHERFASGPADVGGGGGAPPPTMARIVDVPDALPQDGGVDAWRAWATAHARAHFKSGLNSEGYPIPLTIENEHGGGTTLLGTGSVKELRYHTSSPPIPEERAHHHFAIVPALPNLLRAAVPDGPMKPPEKPVGPDIRGFQTMYAAARIGSHLYKVKLTIRVQTDGRRFYDSHLSDMEVVVGAPAAPPVGDGLAALPSGGAASAFIHIDLLKAPFNDNTLAKAQAIPPGARWSTVCPSSFGSFPTSGVCGRRTRGTCPAPGHPPSLHFISGDKTMRLTKTQLADQLGLTKTRISQLLRQGLPEHDDGTVDALAAAGWVRDTLTGPNAGETREAARRLVMAVAVLDGMAELLRRLPFAVVAAAAEEGLSRAKAERLANLALLFMAMDAEGMMNGTGLPGPTVPHPAAWTAGIRWEAMFGPDGASTAAGRLRQPDPA